MLRLFTATVINVSLNGSIFITFWVIANPISLIIMTFIIAIAIVIIVSIVSKLYLPDFY